MSAPLNPISLYEAIKDAYLSYYDTAFNLADEGIQAERRELLSEPGVLFTEPLLEPVPRYAEDEPIAAIAKRVGLDSTAADLLARSVFSIRQIP